MRKRTAFLGVVPVVLLIVASTGRLSITPTTSAPVAMGRVLGDCQYTSQQLHPTNCIELSLAGSETLEARVCSNSSVQIEISDVAEEDPVSPIALSFLNSGASSGITLPDGTSVNLTQYVTYSPPVVTISTGETVVITLTMTLPCGLDSEIAGQTATLLVGPSVVNARVNGLNDVGVDGLSLPVSFQ